MQRGTWLALGAMAVSVFVVANDVTALSVALPQIEQDFNSDVGTVQWVVSAYALVFGVRCSRPWAAPLRATSG